jgi:hypothetical protein
VLAAQAEKHQFGIRRSLGDRQPVEPAPLADLGQQSLEPQQQRIAVAQRRETGGIGAEMVGAVERLAGEGDRHAGPRVSSVSLSTAAGNASVSG